MANQIGYNLGRIINALPGVVFNRLDRACYRVENKAKENCHVKSGILRASTSHYITDGKTHTVAVYNASDESLHEGSITKSGEYKGVIGTNVDYGPIEHDKHHPYLQMAFDETMTEVRNEFTGLLEEADRT